MFTNTKAFSGFAVDDVEKARGFYADTLGVKTSEDNGLLTLHIAGDRPTLVYPRPNHTPAEYTILNFPVDDIEQAVDELTARGVRFMIDADETDGGFSLVEHPMSPRALAAPLHRHTREDEYSYILQGRMGALLGDEVVEGGPGDLIFKPRDQWHTFWNAGDEPCRILEIIAPGGFEHFFDELGAALLAVGTFFIGHICPTNLDRCTGRL